MWYLSSQNRALREQEVADLVAAVVEDQRAPVGMLALARIGVLVEVRAVEQPQAVAVAGEVGRHPIESTPMPFWWQWSTKYMKSCGDAVAAGGGVVADRLVAPAARERMLADRQQLEVRVAHLVGSSRPVGGPARGSSSQRLRVVAGPPPTAEVDFVERQRRVEPVGLLATGHPVGVVPVVAVEIGDLRGGARRHLGGEAVGVGLLEHLVVMANLVFVERARRPGRARTVPRCRWECACASGGGGRPSSLKSPMTLTPVALGAQTAKFTPSTPSTVRRCAPSLW